MSDWITVSTRLPKHRKKPYQKEEIDEYCNDLEGCISGMRSCIAAYQEENTRLQAVYEAADNALHSDEIGSRSDLIEALALAVQAVQTKRNSGADVTSQSTESGSLGLRNEPSAQTTQKTND